MAKWGQTDQSGWGNQGNAGNEGYFQGYEGGEETFGGHGSRGVRIVWDLEALRLARRNAERARHPAEEPRAYTVREERIWEQLLERVGRNPDLPVEALDVEVQDGDVTLRGRADNPEARRRAEELAGQVPGVERVANEIDLVETP